MEKLPEWLSRDFVLDFALKNETPAYLYNLESINNQIKKIYSSAESIPFVLRYAMKANTYGEILKNMDSRGLYFDASSLYEVSHALSFGIDPTHITLSSQVISEEKLKDCVNLGVEFTATSLYQLETFGKLFPNKNVGLRFNPGIGSGSSNRLTTGGVNASFGIWYEYLDRVLEIIDQYKLVVNRIHIHIGSGADAKIWEESADIALSFAEKFKTVSILNLGGGFKVARVLGEMHTDMNELIPKVYKRISDWKNKNNRELTLEIEPGTFLVANAGVIISKVCDIVDTGKSGHSFLRLDTGMTEILRPMLYGAQHPIYHIPCYNREIKNDKSYIVVGHGCESGDTISVEKGDGDAFREIVLNEVKIGDYIVIGGAGAYCASMSAKGYNMFPVAKEYII